MARPPKYRIHPAIGIARLGDADAYFIGPEIPGLPPLGGKPGVPVPPYKDGGKIKPQAARFSVFEYVFKSGEYIVNREVTLNEKDVEALVWNVHVANRKGSFFQFDGLAGFDRAAKPRRNGATSATLRRKFEIDPGERTISGRSKGPVEIEKKKPLKELWPAMPPGKEIKTLGRLATDDAGRLIFVGARGVTTSQTGAAPISTYANNDGWFDDVSDGPVKVYLKLKGKSPVTVEPAWVICAPPDFAPGIGNVVTLYDVLYDLAARELTIPKDEKLYSSGSLMGLAAINAEFKKAGKPELKTYKPDFNTEIYPILERAARMAFVHGEAAPVHSTIRSQWKALASNASSDKPFRDTVFLFLRPPDAPASDRSHTMPKLLGDEPYKAAHQRVRATLTFTQYALMKQWAAGNFVGSAGAPGPLPLPQQLTPEGLDRAALEACVGAAMYPGIEVSWQIRWASIFAAPFRIDHTKPSPYPNDLPGRIRAGHFTRQMALPWQADFRQCKKENSTVAGFSGKWAWWPAQRPDDVFVSVAEFKKGPSNNVPWHRASVGGSTTWPSGAVLPNDDEMIANWKKFGFVIEAKSDPGIFIEDERASSIP